MAIKIMSAFTAIGASPAVRIRTQKVKDHRFEVLLTSLAATKISAVTVQVQGSAKGLDRNTGVITNPTLVTGSTPERFANSAFYYRIKGINYTIAADAVGAVFTANHVVSASKWGVINIYAIAAETFVTRVPLATQAYDTAAAAMAAGDLVPTMDDECYLGRILILNNAGTWTANTDDLTTGGSDLTSATFMNATSSFIGTVASTYALTADDITNQRAAFNLTNMNVDWIRVFLSELTGTGQITVWYTPVE